MIDALLASLEGDAEAEIEGVHAAARTRAAAIAAHTTAQITRDREATLGRRVADGRAAVERGLADARRAARARTFAARDALLTRLFQALRAVLPAVTRSRAYRVALPASVAHTMLFAGGEPVLVRCTPALAPLLKRLGSAHRVTVRPDPSLLAGYRLATADGVLEVDGTLDGRMERMRPRLGLAALAALAALRG